MHIATLTQKEKIVSNRHNPFKPLAFIGACLLFALIIWRVISLENQEKIVQQETQAKSTNAVTP